MLLPFIPDLRSIVDSVLMILFFVSGIFFNLKNIDSSLSKYLSANPIAVLITEIRDVIFLDQNISFYLILLFVFFISLFLIFGFYLEKKLGLKIAKLI